MVWCGMGVMQQLIHKKPYSQDLDTCVNVDLYLI